MCIVYLPKRTGRWLVLFFVNIFTMIEKTIRDLDYADYRLVDYGTDTILVEYKEKTHWRVVKKERCYVLESLSNGVSTVNIKYTEKDLSSKKILRWVLNSIGAKNKEC